MIREFLEVLNSTGYSSDSVGSCPGLDHIFIQLGPASPMPPSCPHLCGNSSSLETNVTILGHLSDLIEA
jgi:hypothetical protein